MSAQSSGKSSSSYSSFMYSDPLAEITINHTPNSPNLVIEHLSFFSYKFIEQRIALFIAKNDFDNASRVAESVIDGNMRVNIIQWVTYDIAIMEKINEKKRIAYLRQQK